MPLTYFRPFPFCLVFEPLSSFLGLFVHFGSDARPSSTFVLKFSIILRLCRNMLGLALLALLPAATLVHGAANDWSKPCFSGSCAYHTGDGIKTAHSDILIVSFH